MLLGMIINRPFWEFFTACVTYYNQLLSFSSCLLGLRKLNLFNDDLFPIVNFVINDPHKRSFVYFSECLLVDKSWNLFFAIIQFDFVDHGFFVLFKVSHVMNQSFLVFKDNFEYEFSMDLGIQQVDTIFSDFPTRFIILFHEYYFYLKCMQTFYLFILDL